VYISEYGSKNGSGRISVAREPKWDLCFETRRGKCNQAFREPERAPLGAKLASQYMLRLTLPCAQVAQAELRLCSGMLRNAQECSPSAQVKAAAAYANTKIEPAKKKVESDLSSNLRRYFFHMVS
jgi:hypothetical protein